MRPCRKGVRTEVEEWEEPLHPGLRSRPYPTLPHFATQSAPFLPLRSRRGRFAGSKTQMIAGDLRWEVVSDGMPPNAASPVADRAVGRGVARVLYLRGPGGTPWGAVASAAYAALPTIPPPCRRCSPRPPPSSSPPVAEVGRRPRRRPRRARPRAARPCTSRPTSSPATTSRSSRRSSPGRRPRRRDQEAIEEEARETAKDFSFADDVDPWLGDRVGRLLPARTGGENPGGAHRPGRGRRQGRGVPRGGAALAG